MNNSEYTGAVPLNAETEASTCSSTDFKRSLLMQLENASPLDTFAVLEQVEMYDKQSAHEVIEQVNAEFATGERRVENIVIPVFTSIVDGLLKDTGMGKEMQKKGLTATRIVAECRSFRYSGANNNAAIYSELEKNRIIADGVEQRHYDINEKLGSNVNSNYYRNKKTADKHGDSYFNFGFTDKQRKEALARNRERSGTDRLVDDYSGQTLYDDKKSAAAAEGHTKNSPELDHIIPLEKVHSQLKNNCLLSNEDVRNIANIDDNFAVTSQEINRSKKDSENSEYVNSNNSVVDEQTRQKMLEKEKQAQKAVNKAANKAVVNNIFDSNKNAALKSELKNVSQEAAAAGVQLGIGNAVLVLIKPLYYEIADSFTNGFAAPVGTDSVGEALKFRMTRVKDFVISSLCDLGLTSILDIVKGVISSIIGAIIDLFFGILKQLLTLVKKGFPVAVSAIKILGDKTKSPSERGDAVVKLLGGTIISIVGAMIVDKIPAGNEMLKSILSCLISGCGSLIFMALLDKLDLFSVKAEKRSARIEEIFEARARELATRVSCMQVEVIDLLKKQRLCFDDLILGAEKAIKEKNVDRVVQYSYSLAEFFKVELEYSNTAEFVRWWDQQEIIRI